MFHYLIVNLQKGEEIPSGSGWNEWLINKLISAKLEKFVNELKQNDLILDGKKVVAIYVPRQVCDNSASARVAFVR